MSAPGTEPYVPRLLVDTERRAAMVRQALEQRVRIDDARRAVFDAMLHEALELPLNLSAGEVPPHILIPVVSDHAARDMGFLENVLVLWRESREPLFRDVARFLRAEPALDPTRFAGFPGHWSASEMQALTEAYADSGRGGEPDDVALVLCMMTSSDYYAALADESPEEPVEAPVDSAEPEGCEPESSEIEERERRDEPALEESEPAPPPDESEEAISTEPMASPEESPQPEETPVPEASFADASESEPSDTTGESVAAAADDTHDRLPALQEEARPETTLLPDQNSELPPVPEPEDRPTHEQDGVESFARDWSDWLAPWRALDEFAAEWDRLSSFGDALRAIADGRIVERMAGRAALRAAVLSLADSYTEKLNFFGIEPRTWSADRAPLRAAAQYAAEVERLGALIAAYAELERRPARSVEERHRLWQRMADAEETILREGRTLDSLLGPSAPAPVEAPAAPAPPAPASVEAPVPAAATPVIEPVEAPPPTVPVEELPVEPETDVTPPEDIPEAPAPETPPASEIVETPSAPAPEPAAPVEAPIELEAPVAPEPAAEVVAAAAEAPVAMEEAPLETEAPVVAPEPPAEEAVPAVEEAPTVEETPVEEPPVVEESPAVEEPPVVEEAPQVEESPVVEESSAIEEPPVAEEAPAAVAEPPVVTEEAPAAVEEPPVIEEPAPVAVEPPAPEPVAEALPALPAPVEPAEAEPAVEVSAAPVVEAAPVEQTPAVETAAPVEAPAEIDPMLRDKMIDLGPPAPTPPPVVVEAAPAPAPVPQPPAPARPDAPRGGMTNGNGHHHYEDLLSEEELRALGAVHDDEEHADNEPPRGDVSLAPIDEAPATPQNPAALDALPVDRQDRKPDESSARPEPVRPEPVRTEPVRSEPVRPEPVARINVATRVETVKPVVKEPTVQEPPAQEPPAQASSSFFQRLLGAVNRVTGWLTPWRGRERGAGSIHFGEVVSGGSGEAGTRSAEMIDDFLADPSGAPTGENPYGRLFVDNLDPAPLEIGPVSITREEGARSVHRMLAVGGGSGPSTSFQTTLIIGKSYTINFSGLTPNNLRLTLRFRGPGDWVRIALPYTWRQVYVYRDQNLENPLAAAASMRSFEASEGDRYYLTDGTLLLKLVVQEGKARGAATLEICLHPKK